MRAAGPSDADAIGRIQVETWRAAYTGLMPDEAIAGFDVESRQELWREWFREPWPRSVVLVAERDGDVVGFVNTGPCRDEEGVAELYAIYVLPAAWGAGAGRALITRAEESMRSSGFGDAVLWVMDGNERAIRFYEIAGWQQDGRRIDEFQGATVTALRYRKRL